MPHGLQYAAQRPKALFIPQGSLMHCQLRVRWVPRPCAPAQGRQMPKSRAVLQARLCAHAQRRAARARTSSSCRPPRRRRRAGARTASASMARARASAAASERAGSCTQSGRRCARRPRGRPPTAAPPPERPPAGPSPVARGRRRRLLPRRAASSRLGLGRGRRPGCIRAPARGARAGARAGACPASACLAPVRSRDDAVPSARPCARRACRGSTAARGRGRGAGRRRQARLELHVGLAVPVHAKVQQHDLVGRRRVLRQLLAERLQPCVDIVCADRQHTAHQQLCPACRRAGRVATSVSTSYR